MNDKTFNVVGTSETCNIVVSAPVVEELIGLPVGALVVCRNTLFVRAVNGMWLPILTHDTDSDNTRDRLSDEATCDYPYTEVAVLPDDAVIGQLEQMQGVWYEYVGDGKWEIASELSTNDVKDLNAFHDSQEIHVLAHDAMIALIPLCTRPDSDKRLPEAVRQNARHLDVNKCARLAYDLAFAMHEESKKRLPDSFNIPHKAE